MANAEEQQAVDRPPIVYVHIPKTGGTTVHNALLRAYGAENVLHAGKPEETQALREMPRQELRSFDVISAHMSQPELENRVGPGAMYITAVRQPVERFLSL